MIKGSKICGISDSQTLNYIINHQYPPQFIGFICNYPKSKRYVEFNDLKKLISIEKKNSKFVAVLVKPNDELLKNLKDLNFDYYQIYDQTPDQIKNIKNQYNKKIILTLTIKTANDISQYKLYEKILSNDDFFLFDSKGYAETKSFDLSFLKKVQEDIKNKIMVAGGIKIDDDFSKLSELCDYIDISGNLESKKGVKDLEKIDIFLKNINKIK